MPNDTYVTHALLLLNVEQRQALRIAQQDAAGSGVEDFFTRRRHELLGHFVLFVPDDDLNRE